MTNSVSTPQTPQTPEPQDTKPKVLKTPPPHPNEAANKAAPPLPSQPKPPSPTESKPGESTSPDPADSNTKPNRPAPTDDAAVTTPPAANEPETGTDKPGRPTEQIPVAEQTTITPPPESPVDLLPEPSQDVGDSSTTPTEADEQFASTVSTEWTAPQSSESSEPLQPRPTSNSYHYDFEVTPPESPPDHSKIEDFTFEAAAPTAEPHLDDDGYADKANWYSDETGFVGETNVSDSRFANSRGETPDIVDSNDLDSPGYESDYYHTSDTDFEIVDAADPTEVADSVYSEPVRDDFGQVETPYSDAIDDFASGADTFEVAPYVEPADYQNHPVDYQDDNRHFGDPQTAYPVTHDDFGNNDFDDITPYDERSVQAEGEVYDNGAAFGDSSDFGRDAAFEDELAYEDRAGYGEDVDVYPDDDYGAGQHAVASAALELRQIAGLTAGTVLELNRSSYAFTEGEGDVGFRVEVLPSGRVDIIPGASELAIDAQPVTESTPIGFGVLDAGSARFVVRQPEDESSQWPLEDQVASIRTPTIVVPASLGQPAETQNRKNRRFFGRSKADPEPQPLTLDGHSWEFVDSVREARRVAAEKERYLHPDPTDLATRANFAVEVLGHRHSGSAWFAQVGVMYADITWRPTFDNIDAIPKDFGEEYLRPLMSLPSIPIPADLKVGPLGIAGPRSATVACARHILVSLYALNDSSLTLHVVTGDDRPEDWAWAQKLAPADGDYDPIDRYPVLIVDGAEFLPPTDEVYNDVVDQTAGLVITAETIEELPPFCGTVLQVDPSGSGLLSNHQRQSIAGTPVGLTSSMAESLAADLYAVLDGRR